MPELPEVETSRRSVDLALKGKKIVQVIVDTEDKIGFDGASPAQFKQAVEGARVVGSGRKGKYFWLELDRRPWPVFHLGMTGNVEIRRKAKGNFAKAWGGLKLWSEPKKDLGAHFLSYCRLRMVADDGTEMAITDPRRFGRIRLARDPLREAPISKLGYDPLQDFPNAASLAALLKKRKAPIKAVLLDQKVFAGVGNWIADEVLFQARISPHRQASSLTGSEVTRLRRKLLAIVGRAVSDRADYERYPRSWLFHYRWGKDKNAKTSNNHPIQHDTVGGRTTAWVPTLQK